MSQLNDLDFVKYYLTKKHFDEHYDLCDTALLSMESANVLRSLPDYYSNNPEHTDGDISSFGSWFLQFHIATETIDTKKRHQAFLKLVKARDDAAEPVILKSMQQKKVARELQKLIKDGFEAEDLQSLASSLEQVSEKSKLIDDLVCTKGFNDLFDNDPYTQGLEWPLDCLNRNLNKIPEKGFFMVLAGRPGSCKSSLTMNIVVHCAKQIEEEQVIIWFNNEGSIEEMKRRFLVTVLGCTREEILQRRQEGYDMDELVRKKLGGEKVIFVELAHRGIGEADKVLKHYGSRIRLIIVDMLDNVNLRTNLRHLSNTDAVSGMLYQWWLGASCLYAPVIGTSQMNKVEDPRFPKLEDLVGSKNLKQGAASCQLMVGHDEHSDLRYLSTPKNKYGKGGTTWSATVMFNPFTNSFEEV